MTSVQLAPPGLDPSVFRPDAIDPETTAFNEQIETLMAGTTPIWTRPAAETRADREAGMGPFGPLVLSEMAQDRTIPGPAGPMRLRTFVPRTINGVYLHIHGGGWTLGGAHHTDVNLERLSVEAQVAVLSVDYRLAPEHPYPAGLDDCEAAAVWLIENAQKEFGTQRLLIGGESAGGHLSVTTLLRLRDKHNYAGFAAANLTFGAFDLSSTPSARIQKDYLVLDLKSMDWFIDQFVPLELRREPDVSPLYANLHSLPPALFTIGTLDPLLDDSLFMYSRWIAAGNQAELAIYPGAVHGFVLYPYAQGRQANARINDFLARR
jgi:acetyl esterase